MAISATTAASENATGTVLIVNSGIGLDSPVTVPEILPEVVPAIYCS